MQRAYQKHIKKQEYAIGLKQAFSQVHSTSRKCRIYYCLPDSLKILLKNNAKSELMKLEAAHIKPRSRGNKEDAKEVSNMVLINKFSHRALDSYKDPIFNKFNLTINQREDLMCAACEENKDKFLQILKIVYPPSVF